MEKTVEKKKFQFLKIKNKKGPLVFVQEIKTLIFDYHRSLQMERGTEVG